MRPLSLILGLTWLPLSVLAAAPSSCACGYYDPATNQTYTDAIIVYYNETSTIPSSDFRVENFTHTREHAWNAIFRQASSPNNAEIKNVSAAYDNSTIQALELRTNAASSDHVVTGASLRTLRQDIRHGVFITSMRGAGAWAGGTALSLLLNFNESDGMAFSLMNMNKPEDANMATLVNGEWPSNDTKIHYSKLQKFGIDPWAFVRVRMDWNETNARYSVNGRTLRSISTSDRSLPIAGQPMTIATWSTGDTTYMEGPPTAPTAAHVLYVRAFFNSSDTTREQRRDRETRCSRRDSQFCSISDTRLRGSTPYTAESTQPWQDVSRERVLRKTAGIVAGGFGSIGVIALINALCHRVFSFLKPRHIEEKETSDAQTPSKKDSEDKTHTNPDRRPSLPRLLTSMGNLSRSSSMWSIMTPLPPYTSSPVSRSGNHSPAPGYMTPVSRGSPRNPGTPTSRDSPRDGSVPPLPGMPAPAILREMLISRKSSRLADDLEPIEEDKTSRIGIANTASFMTPQEIEVNPSTKSADIQPVTVVTEKGKQMVITKESEIITKQDISARNNDTPAKKRVEYMAGLVAVSCLGVTVRHFLLTFWPYPAMGFGLGAHYPTVEKYLSIPFGSVFFTQLLIGPFFLAACRFQVLPYLRKGELKDIAVKMIRRVPRMLVPVFIIALLEYFLISMGTTDSLEWLPSVTWAKWPYVVAQQHFGIFLNNMIQLTWGDPTVMPEVISHYCTGVLWTIPVQLQFTFVVLVAAVLIRDIKSMPKRALVYTLTIVAGWYAKSWSACHWAGLLFADLEATYNWMEKLKKRPLLNYACLASFTLISLGVVALNILEPQIAFTVLENSIHPDIATAQPNAQITPGLYPEYYEPTLAILLFSICIQGIADLSIWTQKALSIRAILWLHPHIMTIYLTHGFVFWSWGAWFMLFLNNFNLPYWVMLLLTFVTCYSLIFLLAWVLTPLLEFCTQASVRNIERWYTHEPVPKRNTTAPNDKNLVLNRREKTSPEATA